MLQGICAWMRRGAIVGAVAVLAVAGVGQRAMAGYVERFQPDDGTPDTALHGVMPVGEDGSWTSHMEGGFYLLENRNDPTAVRYYYVLPGEETWGSPGDIIRVDVGGMLVGGEYHSGAGLLFGFDPESRNYYAFVLQDGPSYALYRRDAGGLRMLASSTHGAIRRAGRNRLEVQLGGASARLLINGTEVASLSEMSLSGSGVGLLALGAGRFEFDNFELPNATPPAGGQGLLPDHRRVPAPPMPTSAPAPTGSLPTGYRPLAHAGGGNLWVKREPAGGNATGLMRAALADFSGYFDGRPQPVQAFGDQQGRELQVLFGARRGGMPVQGLAVVTVADGAAVTALAVDQPARLQRSLPGMLQALQPLVPRQPVPAARVAPMQRTPFPDGSGSMDLPVGWQITSAIKGMVEASGPDESMVAFGIHGPVYTPEGAAQLQQSFQSVGMNPALDMPVIPYTDPATAFRAYWETMPEQAARTLSIQVPSQRVTRIVEQHPTPWPGGKAAYLDVEWLRGGAPYRSVFLFGMQPTYGGTWTSYISGVSSPAARFAENLPTLMRIWSSYQVAASVHQERIDKALGDMREVGRIIDQVHAGRQASFDAIHADWTEYIRDTTAVADTRTGELHDAPLYDINRLVEGLNEASGYERYRHVPLRELQ